MQGHPQLVFSTFVHVIFQHSLVIREVLVKLLEILLSHA